METDKVKEKVEGWKATADLFLEKDIRVFVKTFDGNLYFGKILMVGEETLLLDCFAPKQRIGHRKIYWTLISRFEGYQEESS